MVAISMKRDAEILEDEIHRLEIDLQSRRNALDAIIRSCHHQWGETIYDPIIHRAGSSPGDPPGTMGVDWRGPFSWPERREDRWKRCCLQCGKVEYTKSVSQNIAKVPKW